MDFQQNGKNLQFISNVNPNKKLTENDLVFGQLNWLDVTYSICIPIHGDRGQAIHQLKLGPLILECS